MATAKKTQWPKVSTKLKACVESLAVTARKPQPQGGKAQDPDAVKVVPLGGGHSLAIKTANSLTVQGMAAGRKPATVVLKDDKGICKMRMVLTTPRRVPTKGEMKLQLATAARRFLPRSVEKRINIKEIANDTFTLYYFELTDKRENAGDGRFMRQGLGASGKDVCQFMMLTDQKTSDAKKAILAAMGAMKIVTSGEGKTR